MKPLFHLPNRHVPFTAQQYIDHCTARKNRIACARIEFRDACVRLAWMTLAALALLVSGLGFLFSLV